MKKDQGSDSLFHLVQSLDANERGYVKKFLKRHSDKGNVNLDLVEALEKQKEFNETPLKKKFKNLAVVKVQAWDEVMDALRIYNKKEIQNAEVFSVIAELNVLMRKGLRNEAKKLTERFIQRSYEQEDFYALIAILPFNGVLYAETEVEGSFAEFEQRNQQEIIIAIDKLREVTELGGEAVMFYALRLEERTKSYAAKIASLRKKILFDKEPLSNTGKYCYYQMIAFYNDCIGEELKSIEYLEKAKSILVQKLQNTSRFETRLAFIYLTLIDGCIQNSLFDKANEHISFFQAFPLKQKLQAYARNTALLHLRLLAYNLSRDIERLTDYYKEMKGEIVPNNKILLRDIGRADTIQNFKLDYLISLLLLEKHTEALRWILECDNDKTFRTGDVNYQLVLIVEIVLNYVLSDFETAEKLAKKHSKNKVFQHAPLYAALAVSDKKKLDTAINEAIKNSKEKSNLLLGYFDVFDWIKTVWK